MYGCRSYPALKSAHRIQIPRLKVGRLMELDSQEVNPIPKTQSLPQTLAPMAAAAATGELVGLELMDPNPDIYELFAHYNSLYFRGVLGACLLSWSSTRIKSCAGTCKYFPEGFCEISLSEPVLRFRSTADLKNTLLHEMIHAFLWIEDKNKNHSDHGPRFQSIMEEINSSSVADLQRPSDGYNITIYHEFREEVDSYRVNHWLCESCGDLIKRAVNREPSAIDCIENMGHAKFCGNSSCHWHRHKMSCSGTYAMMAPPAPPGYEDKRRVTKGVQDRHVDTSTVSYMTRRTTKRLCSGVGKEDKPNVKKPIMTTELLMLSENTSSNSSKRSRCSDTPKREVQGKELMVVKPNINDHWVTVPKRRRNPLFRKRRSYVCTEKKKAVEHKDQCPVMSAFLGYYAEEETDEDIEPLINKKTERRKKQKLLQEMKEKAAYVEAIAGASLSRESNDRTDGEGRTNDSICCGEVGRWRQKKVSSGSCEGASPVRDDIIDISD